MTEFGPQEYEETNRDFEANRLEDSFDEPTGVVDEAGSDDDFARQERLDKYIERCNEIIDEADKHDDYHLKFEALIYRSAAERGRRTEDDVDVVDHDAIMNKTLGDFPEADKPLTEDFVATPEIIAEVQAMLAKYNTSESRPEE